MSIREKIGRGVSEYFIQLLDLFAVLFVLMMDVVLAVLTLMFALIGLVLFLIPGTFLGNQKRSVIVVSVLSLIRE